MTLTLRSATLADAPVLVEYNRLLALESEQKTLNVEVLRRGVDNLLRDPARGVYFVAEREGDVVGQLMITYEWSDWRNGNVWWIQSVYVAPEHRGRKLYSGLYGFVRTLAASDPSVRGIRLYVNKQNRTAQKAYAALGMSDEHYHLFEWMKPL